MCRFVVSLTLCMIVTGCTLFPSGPVASIEALPELEARSTSPTEVAALPPGAKIRVAFHHENLHSYTTGEVLHASPQGLAMMNVKRHSSVITGTPVLSKVPYISRLFKNTGVGQERLPVHWVPLHLISTVDVIEPPPADYVAPQLAIDTTNGTDFERIGIDFDFNIDERFTSEADEFVIPVLQ